MEGWRSKPFLSLESDIFHGQFQWGLPVPLRNVLPWATLFAPYDQWKASMFSEFICANGHKYRAHPSIYNGKPWHDHAMVRWCVYTHPLPGLIHAFIDLRQLPPGARITLRESRQPSITAAGVYALIHSFSPLDKERDFSNTMFGHYKLDRKDKH